MKNEKNNAYHPTPKGVGFPSVYSNRGTKTLVS